jgi:hypothetical protein
VDMLVWARPCLTLLTDGPDWQVEAFIPLLLQTAGVATSQGGTAGSEARRAGVEALPGMAASALGVARPLKRLVLLGDHNQLPPIIQNPTVEQHCGLGQSMFARFVRLGAPVCQLDAQGRARPELARLFEWQYPGLRSLPHTSVGAFALPNPGFADAVQFVDVPAFQVRWLSLIGVPLPSYAAPGPWRDCADPELYPEPRRGRNDRRDLHVCLCRHAVLCGADAVRTGTCACWATRGSGSRS